MTDPSDPCVNACTDRVPNPEWQAGSDIPPNVRVPRPATDGLLCRLCAVRLWEWITDITVMFPSLSTDPTTAPPGGGIAHQKVSHSPSLIRLDVAVMLDPWAKEGDGVRSVLGTLAHWANELAEFIAGMSMPASLRVGHLDAVNYLRHHWVDLVLAPWVGEAWARGAVGADMVARATDWPAAVGHCAALRDGYPDADECGRTVFEGDPVTCDACGHVWVGRDKAADPRGRGMSKAAPEPGQTIMRGECRSCGRPIERYAGRGGTEWLHEDVLTGEHDCDPESVAAHRAWKRYRRAAER